MRSIPARVAALAAVAVLSLPRSASAWIYPEHRDIAGEAVQGLDPARRAAFDRLWAEARAGHEARLCGDAFAGEQGPKPSCIDWAAWPAISGDHSCSVANMLSNVLDSPWILNVAAVASKTKATLASATRPDVRQNRLTRSDLDLERADPDYSSRAGANNSHFMLPGFGFDAGAYGHKSVEAGVELNAIGIVLWHHAEALRLAGQLQSADLTPAERSALALKALATEAYALHFLEDSFAAGHAAGTWGEVAQRKGTHDYYNAHGLATQSWSGEPLILMGDSHMRQEDLQRAARAVRVSLAQLLDALEPGTEAAQAAAQIKPPAPGELDTCRALRQPSVDIPPALSNLVVAIASQIPLPALGPGPGSLPRFRSEIGAFLGLASAVRGAGMSGGFESEDAKARAVGSVEIAARLGIGLDAVIGDAGDGLVFVQAGLHYQSKQPSSCTSCSDVGQALLPRVPARNGFSLRARVPFWLIPGDLVVAVPLLVFLAPDTLKHMAIQSASGGLIPWQTGFETPVGRFQFVAGREAGVTLFGYIGGEDVFLTQTGTTPGGQPVLVPISMRAIEIDFPFLEYRPFRDFSAHQTVTLLLQVGGGVSLPQRVSVLVPGLAAPPLKKGYFGYVRLAFDWRRYFSSDKP